MNDEQSILGKDFPVKFLKLPEDQMIQTLQSSLETFGKIGAEQIDYIESWKQLKTDPSKSERHMYVFNTVAEFWEGVDYVWELGDSESHKHYALLPTRLCQELFFRLNYFCSQNEEKQDEISVKEMLKSSVRYYRMDKSEGLDGKLYKETYDAYKERYALPEIDDIKDERFDPHLKTFPGMEKLIQHYKPVGFEPVYLLYQYLCDNIHGNFFARIVREQSGLIAEYRRAVFNVYPYAKQMLILADKHFFASQFKEKVVEAHKKAEADLAQSISVL